MEGKTVEPIPINLSFEMIDKKLETSIKLLKSISGGVIIDFGIVDRDWIKVKKGNKIYEIWYIPDHGTVLIYENDNSIVEIVGGPECESPASKLIYYSIQHLFKSIEQEINKYLINLKGNIIIKT